LRHAVARAASCYGATRRRLLSLLFRSMCGSLRF
jgi:hypothetical protein